MKNIFYPVQTFMKACDQTETGFTKQSDLYLNLITEEFIHETLKEYDRKNLVGIADGIADSIWVVAGFLISLDMDLHEIMRVCNINEKYWSKANDSDHEIHDALIMYAELRNEYKTGNTSNNTRELLIKQYATKLITSLLGLANSLNIPIEAVYDEVARSNMSKISANGKVIKNEFGKVQKPESFSPPDIERILKEKQIL